ncbi:MAG: LuxR C-terminal-related transcriptional regulator, partial [Nitrososphaeraceae archaeon]
MDKKQKEALVLAMLEKGESYRSIAQRANVSPNTIKAISNRAGLEETTSISSRAFELYVQQKTPVEVAIALNLDAEKAINYYHQYFMLLGITEFTKAYLQVKDNPLPFVNLVKLVQNAKIGDGEVVEFLKIANGYLPRIRLEYDRVEAELNSLEAKKLNLFNEHQRQCDEISNLHTEIDCLQSVLGKSRFVKNLRKDNEICVKFKQMVKQEMENKVLQQPRSLLRIAIASIFESQRKNPEKLLALYYNTSPTLSVEQLLSQSSISKNQSDPTQFAHNNDSLKNLIL